LRFDFKVGNSSKIRLFANSGEAIVFWFCVAALIFLAIITFYRSYYLKTIVDEYHSLGKNINPILIQMQILESEKDSLSQQQDHLKTKVGVLENTAAELHSKILELAAQVPQEVKIMILPVN